MEDKSQADHGHDATEITEQPDSGLMDAVLAKGPGFLSGVQEALGKGPPTEQFSAISVLRLAADAVEATENELEMMRRWAGGVGLHVPTRQELLEQFAPDQADETAVAKHLEETPGPDVPETSVEAGLIRDQRDRVKHAVEMLEMAKEMQRRSDIPGQEDAEALAEKSALLRLDASILLISAGNALVAGPCSDDKAVWDAFDDEHGPDVQPAPETFTLKEVISELLCEQLKWDQRKGFTPGHIEIPDVVITRGIKEGTFLGGTIAEYLSKIDGALGWIANAYVWGTNEAWHAIPWVGGDFGIPDRVIHDVLMRGYEEEAYAVDDNKVLIASLHLEDGVTVSPENCWYDEVTGWHAVRDRTQAERLEIVRKAMDARDEAENFICIPTNEAIKVLGHPHDGEDDDVALIELLLEAGDAPPWVSIAEFRVDGFGWHASELEE